LGTLPKARWGSGKREGKKGPIPTGVGTKSLASSGGFTAYRTEGSYEGGVASNGKCGSLGGNEFSYYGSCSARRMPNWCCGRLAAFKGPGNEGPRPGAPGKKKRRSVLGYILSKRCTGGVKKIKELMEEEDVN